VETVIEDTSIIKFDSRESCDSDDFENQENNCNENDEESEEMIEYEDTSIVITV